MLIALSVALELIVALRPIVDTLAVRSPGLADQLVRAADGCRLQIAEGSGRCGRDARNRYRIAAGEAQEIKAALEQVEAWGHLPPEPLAAAKALADRLAGLTYGLANK